MSESRRRRTVRLLPTFNLHLHLVLLRRPAVWSTACALCRRPLGKAPVECEGCAQWLCGACYFDRVTPQAERRFFETADFERDPTLHYIFLCQGCRS